MKKYLINEELDIDFSYPDDYVAFLPNMEEIDNTSWWLIGTSKGFFLSCFKFLNVELKNEKLLIPFAKCDETNGIACFDEDHKVYFHSPEYSVESADWTSRFYLEDFAAWLKWIKS